jgi:hypothetical protein
MKPGQQGQVGQRQYFLRILCGEYGGYSPHRNQERGEPRLIGASE